MNVMLSDAVDGFRLAYDRIGEGPAVVLLHGWPGDRTDYRLLAPLLAERGFEVVVPDLRGFGESDSQSMDPTQYGVAAQGRSVVGLIEELGLELPVLAGYDVGSRIAQGIARTRPDLIEGLVIAPPLPGIGKRVFSEQAQAEFWYQAFHRLPVIEELIDGNPDAVRSYLRHFWTHWSGPGFEPELDHLVETYSAPGAFTASISGTGRERGRSRRRRQRRCHRRTTGSPYRPWCCGRSSTRCSRGPGPTGWTTSSATSECGTSTAPVTTRHSNTRRSSRKRLSD